MQPDLPEEQPRDVPYVPGEPDVSDEESAYDLLQRGHALMAKRHNAQAAIVLERATRLAPGKTSILEALGRARHNAGQHELARQTFEALVAADPVSHFGQFGLGEALRKLGREREAWTHLRMALALEPGSALYRRALARVPEPDHAAERAAEDARREARRMGEQARQAQQEPSGGA